MTDHQPTYCCACGKYKAYRDGMCWGRHAAYERHAKDFASTEPKEQPK